MDPGTRRFVSIVLVAMLFLVGLLSALMVLPAPENGGDGEEEDPGWEFQEDDWGEWIHVYDDTTWSRWDRAMPYPVYVDNDATLTIEGSHLTVPLESMVFKDLPPFHVERGCGLVLRNTTVEVEADQGLETAMLAPYSYESNSPVIWRVVNLRDAIEPVLEVAVEFMRGRSYLVVAAQMTPDDPLRPLEVLEPDEVELSEWTNLNVSLADYTGGTPRLAVFVHNSTSRDVMVSDIRVSDGGSPLVGDVRPTGDLRRDGWTVEHFSDFWSAVPYGDFSIQPLVLCDGDLWVEDSRVLSLPGLERQVRQYRPQMPGVKGTTWKAPEEGCINVTGDVTFLSSEVAYTPIKSTGGSARFEGCSFSGDCDLLTLTGWTASVRGCSFAFETREGLWGSGLQDTETWMLALENTGEQVPVEDCTFTGEGEGIGLVIQGASVLVEDCSFADLALGVWDHGAMIPMSWGGIDASVSFSPSCGLYYMETREVHVELNGPDEPEPWDPGYTRWSAEWIEEVPGLEDLYMMEEKNDHYSRFTLPVMVVGPHIGEVMVRELEVNIRPGWVDRTVSFTLDPHEGYHTLWIHPEDDPPRREEHYIFWDWSLDVAEVEGVLRVPLGISVEMLYFSEPYLNISIDGELVDRVDLNGTDDNMSTYTGPVVVDQAIPPGAHNLTITAGATYTELGWVLEMDRLTAWVYRASESGIASEAVEWLTNRSMGALMVDGGVDLEGFSFEGGEDVYYQHVYVLTWEGARVKVEGFDSPSDFRSSLTLAGNGTVYLSDFDLYAGFLGVKNVTAHIEDVASEGYLAISLFNADVRLTGTIEAYDLYIDAWDGARLRAEGMDVVFQSHLGITVLGSKCSFGNCTFSSPGYDGINVGTTWGSRLSLVGCEFIGVPLDLNLYDMNDTVSVTGCTFEGRQARLSVLPSEWVTQLDPEGQVPRNGTVSGNVLTGPGVDMVVHRLVRDRLLGENLLVDGARAYVLFEPEVVIHEVNPGIGYNITTLDSILYQRSGPMSSYREGTRLNYLVDVTEDPLDPTDPGAVPVVVRVAWNHRGPEGGVVGFANVAIASPQVTVSVMDWGNIQFELRLLTENLDIEDNWWTR